MPNRTLVRALIPLLFALGVAACTRNPQAAKQKYMASGDQYLASGKIAEAVIEYRNAVQQDPQAGDARVKLADAYVTAGSGANAVEQYLRASDLLPEDSSVQVKTAGLLLLAGRFDDAKLWAEKVLAREPRNLQAQIILANALAGLKDLDSAIAQINEAIQLDPSRSETYSNLGALEFGRGQKQAAEQAFRKAVAIDDRSATAHLALANFLWLSSRASEAEAELLKVVDLEPDNALAHRVLATFYITTNRAAEAEPHLKKVRDVTKTPEATFALADFYAVQKNDASARAELEPLAQVKATSALAEVRLATLDYRDGKHSEASRRIEHVLESDKTNLSALLIKSAWLMADGRLEEALGSATLAAEKHNGSAAAFFALGRVQAARHQTESAIGAFQEVLRLNPRANDAKVALAQLNLAAGRPDASLNFAQQASAADPANIQARLTVVRGLLAQKDVARAQRELDPLLERYPDSAPVQVLAGLLKGLKKDTPGARKSFDRALQLDADSTEALAGLVALDVADRQVAAARARIDERLNRSGNDPGVLMLAARTYSAIGDAHTAETMLRRLLDADPGSLDAYGALARLYVSQQKLDQALAEFEQLAKRQPRPVAALTFAGMILQSQGKEKEARDHYERALQIDPEAPVAANNLAWMYAETADKLDLALDLARRAKAKLPDQPEVNDTVGWVHVKNDRAAEAVPYFKQSLEKDKGNPTYLYHLGVAYAKSGESSQARVALEQALRAKPDFSEAADARSVLASLQ